MTLLTSVLAIVLFFILPSLGYKLALVGMAVELGDGSDVLLAFLWLKGAAELQLYFLALLQVEGLRAFERTLVLVILDAVGTLEAEVLFAWPSADIWLLGDVVANHTFILLCLLGRLYKGFGF